MYGIRINWMTICGKDTITKKHKSLNEQIAKSLVFIRLLTPC